LPFLPPLRILEGRHMPRLRHSLRLAQFVH
jgi:hypothetical protein